MHHHRQIIWIATGATALFLTGFVACWNHWMAAPRFGSIDRRAAIERMIDQKTSAPLTPPEVIVVQVPHVTRIAEHCLRDRDNPCPFMVGSR